MSRIVLVILAGLCAFVIAQTPVTRSSVLGYLQKDPVSGLLNGSLPLQPFCYITRRTPFKPKSTPEFCDAFAETSCCIPYHDYDMQQSWVQFLGTGKDCAQTAQQPAGIYQPLKEFWCLPCDPDQYQYLTVTPSAPDAPDAVFPQGGTIPQLSFAVCRSFVDRLWPVTDPATGNSNVYDDCAFSYPTACASASISYNLPVTDPNSTVIPTGTTSSVTFQNGGIFLCGNDVVIPSIDVKTALNFMNGQSTGEGPNPTQGFRSPEIDTSSNIVFTIAEDNQNCYNGFAGNSAYSLLPSASIIVSLLAALLLAYL